MNGHPMNDKNIDEAYQSLGMSVCELAVEDYKKALKYNSVSTIKTLEKFFLSGWFLLLCGGVVEGKTVIEEVRGNWEREKTLRRY